MVFCVCICVCKKNDLVGDDGRWGNGKVGMGYNEWSGLV